MRVQLGALQDFASARPQTLAALASIGALLLLAACWGCFGSLGRRRRGGMFALPTEEPMDAVLDQASGKSHVPGAEAMARVAMAAEAADVARDYEAGNTDRRKAKVGAAQKDRLGNLAPKQTDAFEADEFDEDIEEEFC